MRRRLRLTALIALAVSAHAAEAQEAAGGLESRVWLDRGDEPVLQRGEDVRVYYRTSEDAFAAIFRIDSDGRVHLIYPQHPDAADVVRGGRDYRLLFPTAPSWRVEEDPGVGYFFIVASPEPLDFSSFSYDEHYGWDVSAVGDVVYTDPYVAIDDYVARILPDWEEVPYALDFLTYSVGATYSYPRFLCYDCHSYQRYSTWNPYDYTCSTFRVVIWDDPYFYPRYRYSGVNVVVAARPVRASLPRYEVTRRVLGDPVRPVIRTRVAAERRVVEYKEPATATERTAVRRTAVPTAMRSSALASAQERPRGAAPQQVPDTARARPTLQRRPSSRLPVRTPPSARPAEPETQPAPTRAAPSRLPVRVPSGRPNATPSNPPPAATSRPGNREPAAAPTTSGQPRTAPPTTRVAPRSPSTFGGQPQDTRSTPAPRPSVRSVPVPSSGGSSNGGPRPQAAPPAARSRPQAAPSRPQASPRPSGSSGSGSSRPSTSPAPSRPSSSPPARAAAPPRSSEPRPSVRPRPSEPRE
jgi:hypothetical protein